MSKKNKTASGEERRTESRRERSLLARNEDERQVWDAIETARQNVKRITKRELEAEHVPSEVMSFRLK
jgi:hypothetical protein